MVPLGGVALLKELFYLVEMGGGALWELIAFPHFLFHLAASCDWLTITPQQLAPPTVTLPPCHYGSYPSGTVGQIKASLCKLHWYFIPVIDK